MKRLLKINILIILISFCSCKKLLQEEQSSFFTPANFPKDQTEAEAALFGSYNVLQQSSLFRSSLPLILSSQDDLVHVVAVQATGATGFWMNFQVTGSDLSLKNFWIYLWKGVNGTNELIAALEQMDVPANSSWVPQLMAESKALRAFYYFYLVRMYGDLPLRLKPTTEIVVKADRVPATQIYEQILADLNYADNKLPVMANRGGRFTDGAVKALLSQVYITMAGWRRTSQGQMVKGDAKYYEMARDKAKEVIDMETAGVYALDPDYTNVFKNLSSDVYNKEIIMEVQFAMPDQGSNFPYYFGASGLGSAATPLGGGQAAAQANIEFIDDLNIKNTYKTPSVPVVTVKDERYTWNIGNYSYQAAAPWTKVYSAGDRSNTWGIAKYQKIFPANWFFNHATNWPLIRLSDIKLIYAEAVNEIGVATPEAYAQINAIRKRARPVAYKNSTNTILPDLSGLNQDDFREAIMSERAIELLIEGARRFDLIRWGNLVERVKTQVTQVIAVNNVNEINYLMPVPPEDILINGWKQNLGY
jgi:hypothetical protein